MPETWRREVITPAVEQALEELLRAPVLAKFYLAGGTGLALQFGHRRSVDLDFFCPESFNEEILLQQIQLLPQFSLVAKAQQTVDVQVLGTKVSFLGYSYPVLFPFGAFMGARVADPRDIACMKLSAIAARGAKRDFFDLYVTAKCYGLPQLLDLFQRKFAQANYSVVHLLKALTYFADAEKEPAPDLLAPISWEEVKAFFAREAPALLSRGSPTPPPSPPRSP
jgi:hypothetical protein